MENWTMNEKQRAFVKILQENPNGITLLEIKSRYKIDFATGTINALASKGITDTSEEKTLNCDIVYNGEIIGHTTKKLKVYKLVAKAN